MRGALRFGVLGPMDVQSGGSPVAIPRGKPRLVLALLLLESNRVVASDHLIDAVWGERAPSSAPNALQVYVSQLRKAMDVERDVIVTSPPGYTIALGRGELDLDDFERLTAEGDDALAAGDAKLAAVRLRAALALWRGAPLEDLTYEACLQGPIRRLEELRIAVVERRIGADLALGRHAALAVELEQLVLDHPLREELLAQLMLALYRSGRQADALAAYKAGRERLFEQLGLEPSPTLRRLERAILVQDDALEFSGAVGLGDTPVPRRGVMILVEESDRFHSLLALGRALAARPERELILAQPVVTERQLSEASDRLRAQRAALMEAGIAARTAAFVGNELGDDVAKLVQGLPVDLLMFAAPKSLPTAGTLSAEHIGLVGVAPCDVAILCGGDAEGIPGRVVVPFGGEEHEWAALELGAWLARSQGIPFWIAGAAARRGKRDASRTLASASLAVQHALGVAAEPVLVEPGPSALLEKAREGDGSLLVVGLPDRWQVGIGDTRRELASNPDTPVVLVHAGLRPSGLAPAESFTRYTWSLTTA